ncbi:sulfurtransferase-like selenium metabolism protein YedF [Arcobacter sp. CECT 8985]|uniref:sulfurtransferase-like selenium metabolism protein YedF n=1 Tax=Arcobacter sp. CECT 8985 TaxID=1935424 RepID=UPI002810DD17|nr:sulfurtransferase-like selenium metabolism protein YedF [Arcobacter sp. CECT 8985]
MKLIIQYLFKLLVRRESYGKQSFFINLQKRQFMQNTLNKTVFIKSDKIGEGELGSMLTKGFLNAMSQQENLPEQIILVNSAILLATANENDEVLAILKDLEQKGVKIYSCGTCLDFYEKRDDLKVGKAGNANDIINALLNTNTVSL